MSFPIGACGFSNLKSSRELDISVCDPILEVNELEKRYGETVAVDRVSFHVAKGEMFGLLGPNGAGKTSLLSILSLLSDASGGSATLAGRALRPEDFDLRRLIGIVPQELAIYGELSARENLVFFGRLYGLGGRELKSRVEETLAAIGLADRADKRAGTFSGGMKRRLNLGAALIHRPQLLLLDEPTTGVDPQSRNHLFEEIRRVNRNGTTVIYTSHYMEEVQTLCTRIGILDHGQIIACDTLPNLLKQLEGLIQLRVPLVSAELLERIRRMDGVELVANDRTTLHLSCRDVKASLLQLLVVLNDLKIELLGLETEEPNLERVFLHLTGRGLRD